MMRQIGGGSWRWQRLLTLLVLAAIAALALSACGSSKPGGSETSGSAESTETETPASSESSESTEGEGEAETTAATTGKCGEKPETPIEDPEGVVASLPKSTQKLYSGYPGRTRKRPWATFEGTPGPWKIGLSNLAVNSAFETNLIHGLEKAFDQAKEEGLVTGSLEKAILPDESAENPGPQIT